jgi:predicted AlkP superfamily phosphohydrolase/phosphomutase
VALRRRASRVAAAALVCTLAAAAPRPAEAWGFAGHRLVNRRAAALLPPPLRALFAANADYLAEHSVDPDLWRGAGAEGEGPNHFLDLDAFGRPPFPAIPLVEAEHLSRHGAEAAGKGRVPWRVQEVYRELVEALRKRDPKRALERAAVLGHYVADAHVPLHAALNYDGQLTGQTGLHARWESDLVERFQRQIEPALRPGPPRPPGDPVAFTLGVLRESFAGYPAVLASDRATAGARDLADTPFDDRYDHAYFSRLYEREGKRVQARLSASVQAVASLWLQAWQEAGRPALDSRYRVPHVRGKRRAILVSLDGGGAAVLDDAVARGVMPHLARLRARGATARSSLTTHPPKTAAGHAALYTGAWSDRNGIAGNEALPAGGNVLARESGYSSHLLRAEPIWVTAARQGLEASVASATQVYPFAPYLDERRFGGNYGRNLTLFDGYQNSHAEGRVWTAEQLAPREAGPWNGPLPAHHGALREVRLAVDGVQVDGLLYDDPRDPASGLDTLYLGLARDLERGITLKPRPALGPSAEAFAALTLRVAGGESAVHFRLYELRPDGSAIRLYQTPPKVLRSSRPRLDAAVLSAAGGFVGNGASWPYQRGELGPTLWEGGDGTAERRYLETAALVVRQMTRLSDFVHDRTAWTLMLTYLPYPDEALHTWLGRLDPGLPGHDPEVAARLRPFLDEVLRLTDGFVGHLAEKAGTEVVLAVGADHGLSGAAGVVRPNVALARAGLLALDGQGRVDLARTQAVYFPGNSGFVVLNRASRPGGVVAPEGEEAVRRQAEAALRGLTDPATGRAVMANVRDARSAGEPALGGPHGGDLYLEVAPGYDLSPDLQGEAVGPMSPRGVHSGAPGRPELRAAFTLAGPGVAAGVDLGDIRQIDVAPTLCALLGLDPPKHATGRVLDEALDGSGLAGGRLSRLVGEGGHGKGHGPRPRAYGHLALAAEQALQREAAQHLVHRVLHQAQHRADRAVAQVGAERLAAGVALAEGRIEQAPAQGGQDLAHADLARGPGQRVAARLPARAAHEAPAPQQAHDLGHVGSGDALQPAQLGDVEARSLWTAGHLQQAAQPVFLLGAELHSRPRYMSPSCSRAASDIRLWSQGGSKATSTSASFTSGRVMSFERMSFRSTSPMPQPGAVSEKRTDTFCPPSGCGATSQE